MWVCVQVAQLKMNLAAAAEDADTSKSKLEKFKAAAAEKMKQDRAKYLEHLQVLACAKTRPSIWVKETYLIAEKMKRDRTTFL
jgi:hypothetical protein